MKKESVLPKGNLIQATRIIIYLLELDSNCTCTDISKGCGISIANTNNALLWLVNNKILNKKRMKSTSSTIYYINPDWKKLKYSSD